MKLLAKDGHLYRARLELHGFERMAASASAIADKIRHAGDGSNPSWLLDPASAVDDLGDGVYSVLVFYDGPSQEVDLPDEVVQVQDEGVR